MCTQIYRSSRSSASLCFALLAVLLFVLLHTTVAHAAPNFQSDGQNLQLIKSVGGQMADVVVDGNYAYALIKNEFGTVNIRLVVLDVSNPATPQATGSLALNYRVFDMSTANGFLYLAGIDGLHIISVSDPSFPVEVGSFLLSNPQAAHVDVDGHYAYLAGSNVDGSQSLHIVDVTKPASPVEVGNYIYLDESVMIPPFVAVQGNYAYLLGVWKSDLLIVDISNPHNPQLAGRVGMPAASNATFARTNLWVVNQTVYASYAESLPGPSSQYDGVVIVDVSNPLAPKRQGEIRSSPSVEPAGSLAVRDHFLYWGRGDKVEIIDVADSEHPILDTTLEFNSSALFIAKNRLYNASLNTGLQIFDLSTPQMPTLLGESNAGIRYGTFDAIQLRDNLLYATGGGGLQVLDHTTSKLQVIDSLAISGSLFALDNSHAYLAWYTFSNELGTCSGFHVVDITNPHALTVALTHQLGCSQSSSVTDPMNIQAIAKGRLYLTNSLDELYALDLTTLVTSTVLQRNVSAVFIKGNYAYVALTSGGVAIYDLSDPSAFTWISHYPTWQRVLRFAASDRYLLGVGNGSDTYLWDISNPTAPVEVATIRYILEWGLALDGDYLYLLEPFVGAHVFDIVDPTHPIQVADYPDIFGVPSSQTAFAVAHKLYWPAGENGLFVLQLEGTIAGKVVDSFGKPHAGVKVTLNSGQSTQTNAQGDYSFAALPPGSYTIKVESPTYNFQPVEQTLRVPSYASAAINFTLLLKPLSAEVKPDAPTHLSYIDLQANELDFDLPAGVVVQPATLSVLPQAFASSPGQFFTGVRFDLQTNNANSASSSFTFAAPLTITIHYTDSVVAPVTDRNQLRLYWWNGNQWVKATTTCSTAIPPVHDSENQVLTTTVCQSGQFALFGPTLQHFLPLVSRSQLTTPELRGHFMAQHSGKCLNVLDESQQNGANIVQMPCESSDGEIWTVRPQGEYVQLAAKHSQKCLRVADASQVDGAPLVQWSCTGADNELWRLLPTDPSGVPESDSFWLVAKYSGLCLTVQNASQEDKAQVIQRNCSESLNQTWRFQVAN